MAAYFLNMVSWQTTAVTNLMDGYDVVLIDSILSMALHLFFK